MQAYAVRLGALAELLALADEADGFLYAALAGFGALGFRYPFHVLTAVGVGKTFKTLEGFGVLLEGFEQIGRHGDGLMDALGSQGSLYTGLAGGGTASTTRYHQQTGP
jgi:hypothetical protein